MDLVFVGWAPLNRKEKGADLFNCSPKHRPRAGVALSAVNAKQ